MHILLAILISKTSVYTKVIQTMILQRTIRYFLFVLSYRYYKKMRRNSFARIVDYRWFDYFLEDMESHEQKRRRIDAEEKVYAMRLKSNAVYVGVSGNEANGVPRVHHDPHVPHVLRSEHSDQRN